MRPRVLSLGLLTVITLWVAHVNELGRLEVFRGNREAYDLYAQAAKGKKTGLIVLSKQ